MRDCGSVGSVVTCATCRAHTKRYIASSFPPDVHLSRSAFKFAGGYPLRDQSFDEHFNNE